MSDGTGGEDLWMLVYGSASPTPMGEFDLRALLEVSRRNNATLGVTGMLLYRDSNFFQVLEGAEQVVGDLYARIAADQRHRGAHVFLRRQIAQRLFPSWTMGLRTDADLAEEHQRALDVVVREARDSRDSHARAVAKLMQVFERMTA